MNLTEFLLARIAEDEAWARQEVEITDRFFGDDFEVSYVWARHTRLASTGGAGTSFAQGCPSPARVLAECEAKRRIVAEVVEHVDSQDSWSGWVPLRALALPYADHPDYRSEWPS